MRRLHGYFILFLVCSLGMLACTSIGNKSITFNEHIAPIVVKSCAPCHHQGGVAPFPLTNYNEVKKKARTVAKVVADRTMPPWPADPAYSHFVGEKYLTQEEIDLIQNWRAQGMKEGSGQAMAVYQKPNYTSNIGKPDLVLEIDPVALSADMKDRFFLMKIPGRLPKDTFVRAVEFVAGTPDLVHHFNGHLLLYEKGANTSLFTKPYQLEITNGEYEGDFRKLKLENTDGSIPYRIHSAVNYLPGVFGTAYPNGIGSFKLSSVFAFVGNDLHYGPSNRAVLDKSYINVFFTDKPPSREISEIMLGTNGVSKIEPPLQIKPGTISKHQTSFLVPKDISVLTINPHLHMLGKKFLAYAVKPNGDTIPLIRINQWDFRWQYFYTFKKMVHIPKGSRIVAEATFDNTSKNPDNPNSPPKWVGERLEFGGASMRATDEMFQFIITYALYKPGDENISLEPTE